MRFARNSSTLTKPTKEKDFYESYVVKTPNTTQQSNSSGQKDIIFVDHS
jgi:hypothetical protein